MRFPFVSGRCASLDATRPFAAAARRGGCDDVSAGGFRRSPPRRIRRGLRSHRPASTARPHRDLMAINSRRAAAVVSKAAPRCPPPTNPARRRRRGVMLSAGAGRFTGRRRTRAAARQGRIMADASAGYPVTLEIDYPDRELDRITTLLRVFTVIPIAIVLGLVMGPRTEPGADAHTPVIGAGGFVFAATVLMLLFRQKYPRWWFDWNLQLARFA